MIPNNKNKTKNKISSKSFEICYHDDTNRKMEKGLQIKPGKIREISAFTAEIKRKNCINIVITIITI
jgi:hypothetical protein